jgi:hypothetical protein
VFNYPSQETVTGTYATSGNQLTITSTAPDGGVPDSTNYCVTGNMLALHTVSSSGDVVMTLTK